MHPAALPYTLRFCCLPPLPCAAARHRGRRRTAPVLPARPCYTGVALGFPPPPARTTLPWWLPPPPHNLPQFLLPSPLALATMTASIPMAHLPPTLQAFCAHGSPLPITCNGSYLYTRVPHAPPYTHTHTPFVPAPPHTLFTLLPPSTLPVGHSTPLPTYPTCPATLVHTHCHTHTLGFMHYPIGPPPPPCYTPCTLRHTHVTTLLNALLCRTRTFTTHTHCRTHLQCHTPHCLPACALPTPRHHGFCVYHAFTTTLPHIAHLYLPCRTLDTTPTTPTPRPPLDTFRAVTRWITPYLHGCHTCTPYTATPHTFLWPHLPTHYTPGWLHLFPRSTHLPHTVHYHTHIPHLHTPDLHTPYYVPLLPATCATLPSLPLPHHTPTLPTWCHCANLGFLLPSLPCPSPFPLCPPPTLPTPPLSPPWDPYPHSATDTLPRSLAARSPTRPTTPSPHRPHPHTAHAPACPAACRCHTFPVPGFGRGGLAFAPPPYHLCLFTPSFTTTGLYRCTQQHAAHRTHNYTLLVPPCAPRCT